jgi:cytochrome c oxidase subunit 2
MVVTLKAVVFLAALFLVWSIPAGRAQSPRRIEITASRFTYDPDTITLTKGEPIVLVLHSSDVAHGLVVDELNIRSDEIKKGKETEVQYRAARGQTMKREDQPVGRLAYHRS